MRVVMLRVELWQKKYCEYNIEIKLDVAVWAGGCIISGNQSKSGIRWCFDCVLICKGTDVHIQFLFHCLVMIESGCTVRERIADDGNNLPWQGNGSSDNNKIILVLLLSRFFQRWIEQLIEKIIWCG